MYNLIINTKKMWTVISILYLISYIGIQYVILVINPNIFPVPLRGIDIFYFEVLFNLALCQLLPLGASIGYLNKIFHLREKIPIRIIFNGHEEK